MRFNRYAQAALAYLVLVILWGAVVRATGSGAGCGDHWPQCNGEVLPSLENVKMQIEFFHRIMSGVSLMWLIGLWIASRKIFAAGSSGRLWMTRALILINVEAIIGAGLVLLKLTALDQSLLRVFSIALHLTNTLLLLFALTAVALHRFPTTALSWTSRFSTTWRWVYLGLFVMLGVTGAMTALGDTLFPAATLREGVEQHWMTGSHILIHLRVIHPILALSYLVLCFREESFSRAWLAGLTLQCALGMINVLLLAPIWMQILHLFVANLLWIGLCRQCLDTRQ